MERPFCSPPVSCPFLFIPVLCSCFLWYKCSKNRVIQCSRREWIYMYYQCQAVGPGTFSIRTWQLLVYQLHIFSTFAFQQFGDSWRTVATAVKWHNPSLQQPHTQAINTVLKACMRLSPRTLSTTCWHTYRNSMGTKQEQNGMGTVVLRLQTGTEVVWALNGD